MSLLRRLLVAGILLLPTAEAGWAQHQAATEESAASETAPDVPTAVPDVLDPLQYAEYRFQSLSAAGNFSGALPYAREIVQIIESGPDADRKLASAYNALAATQLRVDDLAGAEASYMRALDLTETSYGIAASQLVEPLAGLGATYAAMDQHGRSIEFLRHAISVSRRADGLFNMAQLELMNRLATGHEAIGDRLGVLAERIHAVTILQHNFGENDPRTVPAVKQLAELYESMEEYRFARGAYSQMYQISSEEGGAGNPDAVDALLGIARNHRLQFTRQPKSLLEQALYKDPVTGQSVPLMSIEPFQGPRLNREGRRAITEALELLRATDSPPPRHLEAALIEMGDWYVAQGYAEKALPYYTQAWQVHASSLDSEPNPLTVPRQVFYRVPAASQRDPSTTLGKIVTRTAAFRMLVDETGVPRNIVLEASDISETQTDYMRRALEKARYSPRFEDGKPVPTADVHFVGEWDLLEESG